ncbi:MAG: DNA-processing protein DprA [Candidatus Margulisbacteria bacterium]|nr:DNA-processing protein DprA [Candidatus Margulisiibacteriota bacterium]
MTNKDIFLAVSLNSQKTKNIFIEQLSDGLSLAELTIKYKTLLHKHSEEIEKIKHFCSKNSVQIISLTDCDYPALLKNIPDPPVVLYALGNINLLLKKSISIVGTRHCTQKGYETAFQFGKALARQDIAIVSGMASGIDSAAHEGALETNGPTIAVLGSGINVVYPAKNKNLYEKIKKDGLILSEFPPDFQPAQYTFPMRNRIIAGLSSGVVVIESRKKGGALITANYALDYNREVFAIPGSINEEASEGSNLLIQNGAKLTLGIDDVLQELNWAMTQNCSPVSRSSTPKPCLGKEEEAIYNLIGPEPLYIDKIAASASLDIRSLSTVLTVLELKQLIMQLPGKMFVRI